MQFPLHARIEIAIAETLLLVSCGSELKTTFSS